jgi:hypothetical protein
VDGGAGGGEEGEGEGEGEGEVDVEMRTRVGGKMEKASLRKMKGEGLYSLALQIRYNQHGRR